LGPPDFDAGLGVECDDETPADGVRISATGNAGNDLPLSGQRSGSERVALPVIGDRAKRAQAAQ